MLKKISLLIKIFAFFLFSEKRRTKKHSWIYAFFNHKANYLKNANKLSKFVDYTSITCRFSIPIRLPDVIIVNVIIFNRDNNDSKTVTLIQNVSPQQILQLIEYNKQFYDEPMLPTYSAIGSSFTTTNNTTNDDLVIVNHKEDEPVNNNIA
jgi:hypothetical protein